MADTKTETKTETKTDTKPIATEIEKAVKAQADKNAETGKQAVAKSAEVATKVAAKSTKTVKKTATKAKKINNKTAQKATKAARTVKQEQEKMTDQMTNNFDMTKWFGGFAMPGAERFTEMFQQNGASNVNGDEMIERARAAGEDAIELTRANIEAVIEAGRIAASGAKELGTDMIEEGRSQFEDASDKLRQMAEAKDPSEFMQLQSDYARSSFDRMMSDSAKWTERMVKLAGDAMQPVSNRASLNVEKSREMMAS